MDWEWTGVMRYCSLGSQAFPWPSCSAPKLKRNKIKMRKIRLNRAGICFESFKKSVNCLLVSDLVSSYVSRSIHARVLGDGKTHRSAGYAHVGQTTVPRRGFVPCGMFETIVCRMPASGSHSCKLLKRNSKHPLKNSARVFE